MISFWGKHMLHFSHIFEDYKAVSSQKNVEFAIMTCSMPVWSFLVYFKIWLWEESFVPVDPLPKKKVS